MIRLPHAIVLGCSGTQLLKSEAKLFARFPPMGVILFARNIEEPKQVRTLISDLKTASGWDLPIWIDQEGGRVQRLRPPHWQGFPSMQAYADAFDADQEAGLRLLRTGTGLLAQELRDLGIDVDCHPVLDIRCEGAHDIVGDRAFSNDPEKVVQLGAVVIKNLQAQGIVPVMKHFPGHGRALCDSHLSLPEVNVSFAELLSQDLAPFIALKDTPMVMTAHIRYRQWEAHVPATLSRTILHDWWRQEIGYQGLIVSDDLAMHALKGYGSPSALAQSTLKAGADFALYCTGDSAENHALLETLPPVSESTWQRWQRCEEIRKGTRTALKIGDIDEYQRWIAGSYDA